MIREEQLKNEYEEKIKKLHDEQENCNHEWDKIKFDPEIKKEPIGTITHFNGSDSHTEITSWKETKIDRWSRTCKKCGKIEYTNLR